MSIVYDSKIVVSCYEHLHGRLVCYSRGQVVRVLGIGDGYTGCRQTRAVEEGKDEGGVWMEGGRDKRAGCMGGGIRALGGTRRMG